MVAQRGGLAELLSGCHTLDICPCLECAAGFPNGAVPLSSGGAAAGARPGASKGGPGLNGLSPSRVGPQGDSATCLGCSWAGPLAQLSEADAGARAVECTVVPQPAPAAWVQVGGHELCMPSRGVVGFLPCHFPAACHEACSAFGVAGYRGGVSLPQRWQARGLPPHLLAALRVQPPVSEGCGWRSPVSGHLHSA